MTLDLNDCENEIRDNIFKSTNSITNPNISSNDFKWSDLLLEYEKDRFSDTVKLYKIINDPNLSFQILSTAYKQLKQTAESSTILLYELCTNNLIDDIKKVSDLPIWKEDESIVNESYLLPSTYITSIGENILQIFQKLEPLDSDKPIKDNYFNNINLQLWKEIGGAIGINRNYVPQFKEIKEEENENTEENVEETQTRSMQWIIVICKGLLGHLILQIANIKSIKPKGKKQLCTDISYVKNIFSALGLEIDPIFNILTKILNKSYEELKNHIQNLTLLTPNDPGYEDLVLEMEISKLILHISSI